MPTNVSTLTVYVWGAGGGGQGGFSSGGGGSSYLSNSAFTNNAVLSMDGSSARAGGVTSTFYQSSVGVGGTSGDFGSNGGNGEIVLSYVTPAVPEPGSLALLVGLGVSGAGLLVRRRLAV